MKLGSSCPDRKKALIGLLLNELVPKLLENSEKIDKCFRLKESVIEMDDPYMPRYQLFTIEEIPTYLETIKIPNPELYSMYKNNKYNFKERIRILFKGR